MATPAFDRVPREQLPQLLREMPKAELHIHIEGSLEPELIFALARKNGIALDYPSVEALRAAYAFTDLQSFLDIYYAGASVLIDADDFEAMAMAYFRRAAADHVVHAEVFFDPQTHTQRGIAIGTVIEGLARACRRAGSELGVTSGLILCFLRHLSEDEALKDAARRAAAPPTPPRRRARQQRARSSTGEVRTRLRRGRPPRPAPRGPRRRGGPGRLHRDRARRARRGAHRPRRALCGGPRARRAARPRRHRADRVSAVQPEAPRVRFARPPQPRRPACAGPEDHRQLRRPGLFRRLRQRQLRGHLRRPAAARCRRGLCAREEQLRRELRRLRCTRRG